MQVRDGNYDKCIGIYAVNPVPRTYVRGFGALPFGEVRNIHPRTHARGVLWYGVNQPERKTGQHAPTDTRFNFRTGRWEGQSTPNRSVQFIKKLDPQPRGLFVVPTDRVVEFVLG